MERGVGKKSMHLEADQKPGEQSRLLRPALIRFQVGIAGQSGFIDFQQLA